MTKMSLLCSVSAFACVSSGAAFAVGPTHPVTHMRGEVHRIVAAVPGGVTLFDQNSDDYGVKIVSEDFAYGGWDSYDSYGADDFTVPAAHKWKIREVEVTGGYGQGGEGPAGSESVFFYRDKKGLPGKLVAECDSVKGIDNQGSFAIKFPKSCKVTLAGGHGYWMSVVANEEGGGYTIWGWETRNGQNGNPAIWENPNLGFGICPNWEAIISCFGDENVGPDFMFALKGKDVAL